MEPELALSCKDGTVRRGLQCLQSCRRPARRRPARRRLHRLPLAQWKFHRCSGIGEPGFEEDRVPALSGEGRERPRAGQCRGRRRKRTKSAAPAASAGAQGRARSPGRCGLPAFRPPRWTAQSALLRLRSSARCMRSKAGDDARRRNAADPAERAQIPRLRGLLFEERRTPAPGPARSPRWMRRTRWTRSTRRWCTGPTRSSSPSPIRWGAASSLYFKMAERLNCVQNADHHPQPGADPQQGRGLHHRRRAGQHPGGRGPDARLLRRARLHLSAVSLHRPFARLVGRGHGEQRRDRAQFEGAAEGAAHARPSAASTLRSV